MNTSRSAGSKGFTLVEMLTVVSIAGILAILTVPAMQSLQRAGNFDSTLYAFSDSLNLARSYAMAQNTYVYVGLAEVDRAQSTSNSPQSSGVGRVALSIMATKDGTSNVNATAAATADNLNQVRKLRLFDAIHLASGPFTASTGSGNMVRSTTLTPSTLSLPANTLTTGFSLPLGSTTGSGKYNFVSNTNSAVLGFTPQGSVLLNGNAVQLVEIDLQPMAGNSAPNPPADLSKGEQAALLIDGVTGAVTIYRP